MTFSARPRPKPPQQGAPAEAQPRLRDASPSPFTRLDDQEGECVMLAVQNILVSVWYSRGTEAGLGRMERNLRQLMVAYPRGLSTLFLVRGAHLPSPSVRANIVALSELFWSKVACDAVVLLGDGFWASAIKSFVTGIVMMRPRTNKHRVDTRVDTAAAWLSEHSAAHTGIAVHAAELVHAAEHALALAPPPR